jgi:hypothetical protein
VLRLDVTSGKLAEVAHSESHFYDLLKEPGNRAAWFAEAELEASGLKPNDAQCIGFKVPLVFAESADVPENAYVADVYEHVSFLGDLHRQIAEEPNGARVRLRIGERPSPK